VYNTIYFQIQVQSVDALLVKRPGITSECENQVNKYYTGLHNCDQLYIFSSFCDWCDKYWCDFMLE